MKKSSEIHYNVRLFYARNAGKSKGSQIWKSYEDAETYSYIINDITLFIYFSIRRNFYYFDTLMENEMLLSTFLNDTFIDNYAPFAYITRVP